MVATIFDDYIKPEMAMINAAYENTRSRANSFINQQLSAQIYNRQARKSPKEKPASLLARLFAPGTKKSMAASSPRLPEIDALEYWQMKLEESKDGLETACFQSLLKIVGAFVGHRGRLFADIELVCRLAVNYLCNDFGSEKIGEAIDPCMKKAIEKENYRILPVQEKPIVMNVKGASASGKSTIRPAMRQLAEKLDIPWEEFAPDQPGLLAQISA